MKRFSLFLLSLCSVQLSYSKDVHVLHEKMKDVERFHESFSQPAPLEQKAIILTPAVPKTEKNQTVLSVSPLYFKTQIKGSSFALANKEDDTFLPQSSSIKTITPGFKWGVKLGLAQIFGNEKFAAGAEFMTLRTSDSKKTSGFSTGSIIPLKGGYSQGVSFAKTSTKQNYTNLDISLARDFFVSTKLSIKPQMSVKSAWIKTFQKTLYQDHEELVDKNIHVNELSNLWGVGPLAALTAKWYLFEDVFFYVKGAASALYSYTRGSMQTLEPHDHSQNGLFNLKQHSFVPYLELDIGLNCFTLYKDSKKLLQLGIAFESQYYFQARQMFHLEEFKEALRVKTDYEDLSFYGISLNGSFQF